MDNKELKHHGVKGQKWGVRRYQPYRDADERPSGGGIETGQAAKVKQRKSSGLFDQTINKGKGKPNASPAEEITRNTASIARNASSALGGIEKMQTKKQPSVSKSVKKMSDQELRDSINRIKMEREYSSLTKVEKETGMQKVRDVLDVTGDIAGTALAVAGLIATIKKIKG